MFNLADHECDKSLLMQIPPDPVLSGMIKHYLIISSDHETDLQYRIFPDGNPGIAFHFGKPLMQQATEKHTRQLQPESFVYGQLTHYNTMRSNGRLLMLVVVLQPYGLYQLFRQAACDFNDDATSLADLLGQQGRELEDRVLTAPDVSRAIASIEKFFLKRLYSLTYLPPVLTTASGMMIKKAGAVTVRDLTQALPLTEKQLERLFKQYIGIGPKRFADTIKLQQLLKQLKNPLMANIGHLAVSMGYYDQSHLNRSFSKMTSFTPTAYRSSLKLLALNLTSL